ncbi:MAG TPA: TlpA family protein disulfide reductase, partial [Firmicutes bacterium]|nr:TlpA family protein disulfide reductase [Bacillota bacterium]
MKKHILLIGFMILTLVVIAGCQRKPGNNSSNGNENDGFIDPSVTLESLRGKPVFLNFWATWCGPCREELPDLQQMYLKYGDRIQFFTISA